MREIDTIDLTDTEPGLGTSILTPKRKKVVASLDLTTPSPTKTTTRTATASPTIGHQSAAPSASGTSTRTGLPLKESRLALSSPLKDSSTSSSQSAGKKTTTTPRETRSSPFRKTTAPTPFTLAKPRGFRLPRSSSALSMSEMIELDGSASKAGDSVPSSSALSGVDASSKGSAAKVTKLIPSSSAPSIMGTSSDSSKSQPLSAKKNILSSKQTMSSPLKSTKSSTATSWKPSVITTGSKWKRSSFSESPAPTRALSPSKNSGPSSTSKRPKFASSTTPIIVRTASSKLSAPTSPSSSTPIITRSASASIPPKDSVTSSAGSDYILRRKALTSKYESDKPAGGKVLPRIRKYNLESDDESDLWVTRSKDTYEKDSKSSSARQTQSSLSPTNGISTPEVGNSAQKPETTKKGKEPNVAKDREINVPASNSKLSSTKRFLQGYHNTTFAELMADLDNDTPTLTEINKTPLKTKRKACNSPLTSIEADNPVKRPKLFRRWPSTPVVELEEQSLDTASTITSLAEDSTVDAAAKADKSESRHAEENIEPQRAGLPEPKEKSQEISFSTQISDQIDEFIEEAVGDVQDYVHIIFKQAMLKTSLWVLETMQKQQTSDLLTHLDTHKKQNQADALLAADSLNRAYKSYNPSDTNMSLPTEAFEHSVLVKSQNKSQQEEFDQMKKLVKQQRKRETDAVDAVKKLLQQE